jgi:hypothetical protein
MKSPYMFIVKPKDGKRYDNESDGLVKSTSKEDHRFSNRIAEVIETPINYDGPIQKGSLLLVHHNVFKFYFDMKGRQRSGRSYFKDDLFFIDHMQFFMYNNGDGWRAHDKYCFIKPVKTRESDIFKNTKEEPLTGVIRYINDELTELGLKEGDEILYKPMSDYEFTVDGEKLYRMFTDNITVSL